MGLKTVSFKFKNSSNYTQNLTLLNTCPPKSCSNTDYVTGQKIHRVASYSAYNSKLFTACSKSKFVCSSAEAKK